jgi:predicted acylesterase/phospholipase RssA
MYTIEVISTKTELYKPIREAMDGLNGIQSQFLFHTVEDRLKPEAFLLDQSRYSTDRLFQWLRNFKAAHKGKRDYIILVVDVPIDGRKYGNLFGNHLAEEGLAIFTTQRFNQFLHNLPRYCMYYFTRYALSFMAPDIESHPTKDCMFDNKVRKRDLLLSLNSGRICDECRSKLEKAWSPETKESIESMLKLISANFPLALIMKGGGVKGLAYAGALMVLEEFFSFDVFVGTSAGAIAAALLGADYTPQEIKNFFEKTDFRKFKDASFFKAVYNACIEKGCFTGEKLENTIEDLIANKTKRPRIPLEDLPNRTIVYAVQDGIGTITFDSDGERKETPASFAVRCSMSIPGFFIAPRIDNKRVYDGGLKNNFPTYCFKKANPQKPFIGMYLYTPPSRKKSIAKDLIDIITEAEDREIYKDHKNRIVLINTGPISTTDFNLTKAKKEFLLASGRLAALEFIKTYYPDFDISKYNVNTIKAAVNRKLKKLSTI